MPTEQPQLDDAALCFPRTKVKPIQNPLFVYLEGMSAKKLSSKGFIK